MHRRHPWRGSMRDRWAYGDAHFTGCYDDPRRRWPPSVFFRAALHRRLFAAFGLAIVVTTVTVFTVTFALAPESVRWRATVSRASSFVSERYAVVWQDHGARHHLTQSLSRTLDMDVWVDDSHGALVEVVSSAPSPERCRVPMMVSTVTSRGVTVGRVSLCAREESSRWWRHGTVLIAAVTALWIVAGWASRRLTRPLVELVRVVQDIGNGKLSSRARLARGAHGEVGRLAVVVNDMAERIEKQLALQRELLAAVSHELRSPLARMRFELEAMRSAEDETSRGRSADELERELEDIDALVGDLLATSRMDFGALKLVALDAKTVALRAAERAGVSPEVVRVETEDNGFVADATLVATALSNLLSNAMKHGEKVLSLRVTSGPEWVRFEVDDDGAGFTPDEISRAFEPFWRGDSARRSERQGVGLGLALVKRIAEVHGGRAWVEVGRAHGATVGVEFSRKKSVENPEGA